MINEKNVLKLMHYSRNTYYVWKREKRPIIELIDRYFTDSEIEEFLQTGKIINFEATNYIKNNFMTINKNKSILEKMIRLNKFPESLVN